MDQVEELVGFLRAPRPDVRKQAAETVLSLTGTDAGVVLLLSTHGDDKDVLSLLARLIGDQEAIAQYAVAALVNMSTNDRANAALVEKKLFWSSLLETLKGLQDIKSNSAAVPPILRNCVKLLNNVTTSVAGANRLIEGRLGREYGGLDVKLLLRAFLRKPAEIPEAGLVFTNTTRIDEGRDIFLKEDGLQAIKQLITLVTAEDPVLRRGAVLTLRNCCFDTSRHDLLMKSTHLVDTFLQRLIGPEGIESPEDFADLSTRLQDVINTSHEPGNEPLERETEDDVRRGIVDTLVILCTTRPGREGLREHNTYGVVKVYHPTESNEEISEVVFKLVDMLLADEEDIEEATASMDVAAAVAQNSGVEIEEIHDTEDGKPVEAAETKTETANLEENDDADDDDGEEESILLAVD